jgi:YD repeat-containing protein
MCAREKLMRKPNTLGESVFHYDAQGRLIAESDPAGALRREVMELPRFRGRLRA